MLQLGRRDDCVDELVVRDGAVAVDVDRPRDGVEVLPPARSKAVKSAALEAVGSSTRGSGWTPSGPASPLECRAA